MYVSESGCISRKTTFVIVRVRFDTDLFMVSTPRCLCRPWQMRLQDRPRAMIPRRRLCLRVAAVVVLLSALAPSASGGSLWCCLALSSSAPSRGTAARPLDKKRVVVLGAGGYLGALSFGFLQRASSLFGTGLGGVRVLGATADTAVRLNRILSKNFGLAVADESYIKLTDLMDVGAIQKRLEGWDALILGNDLFHQNRPITPGTFEVTPNDKTYEVYWDAPKGVEIPSSAVASADPVQETILQNVISAAQLAGIQHIVAVDNAACLPRMQPQLEALAPKIPYTVIHHDAALTNAKDFSYRKGVQGLLEASAWDGIGNALAKDDSDRQSSMLTREDVAALCVQALQSLDWTQSRCLRVQCTASATNPAPSGKRPDQEFIVNSYLLEGALKGIS